MTMKLERLASCCHGDERPDCPILEGLAEGDVTGLSDAVSRLTLAPVAYDLRPARALSNKRVNAKMPTAVPSAVLVFTRSAVAGTGS